MLEFDKEIIARNFSKAANQYDKNAQIQAFAAQKLCLEISKFLKPNSKILDLGSGTSVIAKNLLEKNPNLQITEVDFSASMLASWINRPQNVKTIQTDIEEIDFDSESFDLVLSSFSLQWINNLPSLLQKIKKTLKKDGIFAFCLPLDGTLKELKICTNQCNIKLAINDFPAFSTIREMLKNTKLTKKSFFQEEQIIYYENLLNLLKSIKEIGGGYSKNQNLLNKNKFDILSNFYLKNFNSKNTIFTTWNIGYFVAVK